LVSGGRSITRANRVGVEKACFAAKGVMIASATAAGLGAPGSTLGGAGGRRRAKGGGSVTSGGVGRKWNVRYRVRGFETVVGTVAYTGPVHLMNNDTAPHEIAPRRKKALAFPDGNVRLGPVQHPGTRGKKFFERAEPIVLAQSERIIKQEVRSHLARTFT
jgi:hypothetical protein